MSLLSWSFWLGYPDVHAACPILAHAGSWHQRANGVLPKIRELTGWSTFSSWQSRLSKSKTKQKDVNAHAACRMSDTSPLFLA
ncbi:hypothetical protein C8R46DRAFT_1080616 [Mycena filopes]|nr:hypothetical protein C8R46DRAFT_1080616 [Mycena filopes]